MFLRSLTLRGFKSFADKTVLEFGPGLSVVVGPNGSGKSNLVDAIAWVLGEQGPAALRGGQMADVVFVGSPGRSALGMAEVSLVIDNEAGLIPVDATEIEVARVIYRSGESQYLIAGESVRLMDVRELLSDAGIGQGMHTVVGQGNLEDVLTARPEERRQFIEEAAGIAKHRRRKERAERKLASLEQDLLRLHDVMTELRRQLKPLKQQAEVATRHEALAGEAEDLSSRLAAARLRDLYADRDRRRSAWEEGLARKREADERLAALDTEIGALGLRLAEADGTLAETEVEHTEAIRARHEADALLRGAVENEGRAREAAAAHRAERESHLFGLEGSRSERERLTAELAKLTSKEEEALAERAALEVEVERLDSEETPLVERQAELKRERDSLLERVAALEKEEVRLDTRRHVLEARRRAMAETPGRRLLAVRPGRSIGLLGELVQASDGMEKALAAALGPMSDAVVYGDRPTAMADAGEAPGATAAVPEGAASEPALQGASRLLDFVRPDARVAELVGRLLADVYVVGDAEEALAEHRKHPALSFVTAEGLLVGPYVVRSAPAPTEEELARVEEHAELTGRLRTVQHDIAVARQRLQGLDDELAHVGEGLSRCDASITSAADRMALVKAELASVGRERDIVSARLARMPSDDDGTASEASAPFEAAVADAIAAREDAERGLESAGARLAERERGLEDARSAVTEIRESRERANESWRQAASALQRLRDEYEDEDTLRRDLERRIEEAERVLADGHDRDPADAVAALSAEDTVETLQRRSDLVSRRLGLLGRVNMVAAEEYQALQERHDFLKREIHDVREARADLGRVVAEIDVKIAEIWDAAYDDVAGEFERMFATVFPDGKGRLVLIEGEGLPGIDIEARPGQKRVKRLSLLSGGERSLTAIAFLFSIFRARPSPFYLLDEVEAALDDVNLHRFVGLVREFAETSQVLLVTHQKRTMEAADVLYGVSMSKDGVSAVISERLKDAVPAGAK